MIVPHLVPAPVLLAAGDDGSSERIPTELIARTNELTSFHVVYDVEVTREDGVHEASLVMTFDSDMGRVEAALEE